jgi:hypothetical protein
MNALDVDIWTRQNTIWQPDRLPTLDEFIRQPSPVPDLEQNAHERAELRLLCDTDPDYRAAEMELCKRDPVRWVKYWINVYEPRNLPGKKVLPFVPYEFQEWLIWYMWNCIEQASSAPRGYTRNVVIPKARDMAASWTMLAVFLHRWRFYGDSFLLISATADKVDSRDDKGCLFEKIRYMLKSMPDWWLPEGFKWNGPGKHDKEMCLSFPEGKEGVIGGEIVGEATTGNSGRSGRVTALGFDEAAAVDEGKDYECWGANAGTTNLRFAISTPDGPNNLFGKMGTGEFDEACDIIRLDWFYHPEKIYTYDPPPLNADGKVPPEWRPDPSFVRTMDLRMEGGTPVSQWYKSEEKRISAQMFAKEVLIDFRLSTKGGVWSSDYNIATHCRQGLRPAQDGSRLIISSDPGTHWMTVFGQIDRYNRYMIFKDKYWENANIDRVWEDIIQIWTTEFDRMPCDFIGDAAGAKVNSAMHKGLSEWMYVFNQFQINVQSDFMYTFQQNVWEDARIQAMKMILGKLSPEMSTAKFLIDDVRAPYVHKALSGKYRYKTDPYGEITGQIHDAHPWNDAADAAGFPLIFRGLVDQSMLAKRREDQGEKTRGIPWTRPSKMRGRYRR